MARGRRSRAQEARPSRLIDEVLVAESWAAFDELLDEAMCLESSTHASRFFNYALDAGRDSLPVERMESARDRVQLFYARRLRENPTSIRRAGGANCFPPEHPGMQLVLQRCPVGCSMPVFHPLATC